MQTDVQIAGVCEPQSQPLQKKTCPKCGTEVDKLTKDHIVPKALIKRIQLILKVHSWKEDNIQMICLKCNQEKAHKLDWSHPYTREFLSRVVKEINKNIQKYE